MGFRKYVVRSIDDDFETFCAYTFLGVRYKIFFHFNDVEIWIILKIIGGFSHGDALVYLKKYQYDESLMIYFVFYFYFLHCFLRMFPLITASKLSFKESFLNWPL